jgi:hypothetical protein
VFLGDHEQYFVRLQGNVELKALEFDAEYPKAERGQTARVGCEPEDVVLLREEA